MKRRKPLVIVVDMQSEFKAGTDTELIEAINRETPERLEKGWDIVYLCYEESGDITVEVPKRKRKIWKSEDDGSLSIMSYLVGNGGWPERIEIWGVNTFVCVMNTAKGLVRKLRDAGQDVPVSINLDYCRDQSYVKGLRIIGGETAPPPPEK